MEPITINLFIFIGIALVTMFFGYFFGLFEGRGQGYKKRKTEEKDEPMPVSVPVIKDDPGLLRLKNENNQLRLDMDGQCVDTSMPLAPAQRKRLIELLTYIRPFLEGGQPAQAAPKPAPVSPAVSTPRPAPVSPAASSSAPLTPVEQALIANLNQPKVEPIPARITLGYTPKKIEQPATALSMVQQIDQILQLKLANTPLAGQGIKIQDAPGGGVMVLVGLKKYDSVGDVPDPAIKAVLQAAVAEWEEKYTPKL